MRKKDDFEVGSFPSTRWSLVALVKEHDSQSRRKALDEILRLYRPALLAHLLWCKRIQLDRAEDLLQAFITRKIVEDDFLARADAAHGRFRYFLRKSLDNYVIDEWRKRRVPGEDIVDVKPGEVPLPPTADVFEVQWARQLLQETLDRMRAECQAKGREDLWELFQCRVMAPALDGCDPPPYLKLVERFGFRSAAQACNGLVTAKRQFERNLAAVITETEHVTSEKDIQEEIADLCKILHCAGPLALVVPPLGGKPEISSVSESNPKALASLLSVRGTVEGILPPAELGDILRHCLSAPVSDYLRGLGKSADFAADSPSELVVVGMTLSELFQCGNPPLALLIAVKRCARRLMNPGTSRQLAEVHRMIYFASIAAALVRHGEQISKSGPEVLRVAWKRLTAESYSDESLRKLFDTARERLSNQGGCKE